MRLTRVDMKHWQEENYIFTNEDMKGSRLEDYDYIVVNDDIERAVAELQSILKIEREKRSHL